MSRRLPLPVGRDVELAALQSSRAMVVCLWGLPGAGTSALASSALATGALDAELIERADLLPGDELERRFGALAHAGRRALLTSRRRIGGPAIEHHRVGPLARADAVHLLGQRLIEIGAPTFRGLAPRGLEEIAEAAGHLPGRLMLAADRAALLTPDEVLASVEELGFDLGGQLADLGPTAQAVLAALASCPAGLSLATLAAAVDEPPCDVLASLVELGDRALVEVGREAPTHYAVIAPVRRSVLAQVGTAPAPAAVAAAIVQRVEAGSATPRERANLTALLDARTALSPGPRRTLVDAVTGPRDGAALRTVLRSLGAALDDPSSYADLGERARLLLARADARIMAGDHAGMLGDLSEAQKLAMVTDDPELELHARVVLSRARHWEARFDEGLAALADHAPGDVRSAEEVRLCMAVLTLGLGDVPGALRLVEDALAELRARGGSANEGLLAGLSGMMHRDLGDVTTARARFREALEAARRSGNRHVEATVQNWLGLSHLDDGDPAAAQADLALARDVLAALGDEHMLRAAIGHLGVAALLEGRLAEAEPLLVRAVRLAEKARDVYRGCNFLAHLAIVRARRGRRADARLDLAAIEHWLGTVEQTNPNLPALLRIARAVVERGAPPDEPRAACSSDVRIALRLLGEATARPHVRIASDGRWFAIDDGAPIALVRRPQLARFLAGLATRAASHVTTGFTSDELFRIGWPRETAIPEAGRHRVHVAVSELRKMGLVHLVSDRGGYRLDADVVVDEALNGPRATRSGDTSGGSV